MAENPKNLKYTKDHEWARKEGGKITVGITAHAQEQLGDVVYVELPKIGATVTAGKQFGVVESTKAVSDLYAPVSGKVTKINDALSSEPSAINADPYGKGWIIEIEASGADYDALLDADSYTALVAAAK